jgi:uncharacterized membrane protein HdeD (DUF308 family)
MAIKTMNRIKSIIFTLLTASAFICGSLLCSLHGKCLHDQSQGSLGLFCTGVISIVIGLLITNLLIQSAHPDISFKHRLVSSACPSLLCFMGSNLIVLKPFIQESPVFSAENLSFYFGVYLILFGVSFLHFLLKD